MDWECIGCKTKLRVEYTAEPNRTGAMSTVDCPICGTSKMIPDVADRIYRLQDGQWIGTAPRSAYN